MKPGQWQVASGKCQVATVSCSVNYVAALSVISLSITIIYSRLSHISVCEDCADLAPGGRQKALNHSLLQCCPKVGKTINWEIKYLSIIHQGITHLSTINWKIKYLCFTNWNVGRQLSIIVCAQVRMEINCL